MTRKLFKPRASGRCFVVREERSCASSYSRPIPQFDSSLCPFFRICKRKKIKFRETKVSQCFIFNSAVRRHPPAHRRPLRTRGGGEDPHLGILQLGPAKQGKENTIFPQKNTICCIVYNYVFAVPRKRGWFCHLIDECRSCQMYFEVLDFKRRKEFILLLQQQFSSRNF